MQAVQLARYHTRRSHLVRFCGAYHGWWGDVQPGIGNPLPPRAHLHPGGNVGSVRCMCCARGGDIACVLVNPLQALHPNRAAPANSSLVDSGRTAGFDRAAYTAWLQQLRDVCTERGIALIFDEVFVGFRLAPGGAAEYFGVRPDLVTYGKTLGGGLPVGVLCGRAAFMKRLSRRPAGRYLSCARHVQFASLRHGRDERVPAPLRIAGNPAALPRPGRALEQSGGEAQSASGECGVCRSAWRISPPSGRSATRGRPAITGCCSTICAPKGMALSWVGTGRLIFSLNYSDADFLAVADRFVAAARAMERDGWWWCEPRRQRTSRSGGGFCGRSWPPTVRAGPACSGARNPSPLTPRNCMVVWLGLAVMMSS